MNHRVFARERRYVLILASTLARILRASSMRGELKSSAGMNTRVHLAYGVEQKRIREWREDQNDPGESDDLRSTI